MTLGESGGIREVPGEYPACGGTVVHTWMAGGILSRNRPSVSRGSALPLRGNTGESPGKCMGNTRENPGEYPGKCMGNTRENPGEYPGKCMRNTRENPGEYPGESGG